MRCNPNLVTKAPPGTTRGATKGYLKPIATNCLLNDRGLQFSSLAQVFSSSARRPYSAATSASSKAFLPLQLGVSSKEPLVTRCLQRPSLRSTPFRKGVKSQLINEERPKSFP